MRKFVLSESNHQKMPDRGSLTRQGTEYPTANIQDQARFNSEIRCDIRLFHILRQQLTGFAMIIVLCQLALRICTAAGCPVYEAGEQNSCPTIWHHQADALRGTRLATEVTNCSWRRNFPFPPSGPMCSFVNA